MAIPFNPDDVTSGFNLTKLNSNFDKTKTALSDALSRSGNGPNQMEADIDLNSNDLLNANVVEAKLLVIDGETAQVVDLASALKATNALSEISALGLQATARTNLGLGTAATANVGDFANTTLSNAKWLVRNTRQGGGDVNFSTTDSYESYNEGAAGLTEYHGTKVAGTGIALGPLSGGPAGAPGSVTLFENDVRYSGTLADNNGFLIGHSARIIATAGFKGGLSHLATTIVRGTPGASPGNQNYVGLTGQGIAEVNAGGTDTGSGARGAIFGLSAWTTMFNAATNYLDACSEFDLVGEAGATVAHASAITLADGARFRGAQSDSLLRLTGYSDFAGPGIGRNHLILITDANSADPSHAGSILIGAQFFTNPSTKRNAVTGIDFSAYNFSSAFLKYGQFALETEFRMVLGASGSANTLITNSGASQANATLILRPKGTGNIVLDTNGGGFVQFGRAVVNADIASNRRVRVQMDDGTVIDLLGVLV